MVAGTFVFPLSLARALYVSVLLSRAPISLRRCAFAWGRPTNVRGIPTIKAKMAATAAAGVAGVAPPVTVVRARARARGESASRTKWQRERDRATKTQDRKAQRDKQVDATKRKDLDTPLRHEEDEKARRADAAETHAACARRLARRWLTGRRDGGGGAGGRRRTTRAKGSRKRCTRPLSSPARCGHCARRIERAGTCSRAQRHAHAHARARILLFRLRRSGPGLPRRLCAKGHVRHRRRLCRRRRSCAAGTSARRGVANVVRALTWSAILW